MLIGFLYAIFAALIIGYELSRKKRMLYDQLSIANIFFLGYLVVPPAFLNLVLDTELVQVDRVVDFSLLGYLHHRAEPLQKMILLLGSIIAYCALCQGYNLCVSRIDFSNQTTRAVNRKLRFAWIAIGLLFAALMFVFGNSLVPGDPLGGLLLSTYYRAEDAFYAFERTPLNANIYAATSTFLLFSVLGVALSAEKRRSRFLYLTLAGAFVLLDSLASGARRNLLIAALLVYLYVAVRKNKYKLHYFLSIFLISVPMLTFGKAILRNLGDLQVANLGFSDVTLVEQFVAGAADIGQSHLESIGTLALYDGGPRFGADHLFSVLRMIPLGVMGLEKPWPERIVRISTAYQSGDPTMQDIPPGYLGQCWIDFPFIGFFVIPLLHGACFAFLERNFRTMNLTKSPFYLMAYLVAGYLVAMPLNTGTLDYLCSPEIALTVLIFFLLHFINTKRLSLGTPTTQDRPGLVNSGTADPKVARQSSA